MGLFAKTQTHRGDGEWYLRSGLSLCKVTFQTTMHGRDPTYIQDKKLGPTS